MVVTLLSFLHEWFGIYVMYEGDFSPTNIILNMLMIRTDINAVMWSMKVECFATPMILFCAWLARSKDARWLWPMIAILFALSFWGPYVHALGDATNLAPLDAFVFGVLVQHHGKHFSHIRLSHAVLLTILSILVFFFCGTRKQTAPILLLECISAALLVALIAWRPIRLHAQLDSEFVRFYGRISYSFYLLHVLGMSFAIRILDFMGAPPVTLPASAGTVVLTAFSILITTPAAYLSWRYIEVPFINLGKAAARYRAARA